MTLDIFSQLSILLVIATATGFLTKLLRQPFMIAYILTGIAAGPLLFNLLHSGQHFYEVFSDLGIILLLFVVGLSLNFNYLKKVGRVALVAGVGQVVFTAIIGILLLKVLGFSLHTSVFLAVAITFSSTIIITKLLSDKKDTDSVYGRYTIGLMLVQDVIAIVILLLLDSGLNNFGLLQSILLLVAKGAALIGATYILSRFVVPKLLDRVAYSNEFLFLFTLAWCFGITVLIKNLGFSLEVGAIFAGLSLSSSPYQMEIGSRVKPLRDFFLILFFIILGAEMNLANLSNALVPGVVLSLFILIGNPFILYILFRVMKFTRRNSFLAGLTAAQVSEFGFILLFIGKELGYVSGNELAIFTVVALVTIFTSSYLITFNEQLYKFFLPMFKFFGKDRFQQLEKNPQLYDTWIIGYHRIGMRIVETLRQQKKSFAVIDFNPEVVKQLEKQKIPVFFGDVADIEFLAELPLHKAKTIISTIPSVDDQINLLKHVRAHSKKVNIIVNSSQIEFINTLYAEGADYVIMPHLLGGSWISELLKKTKFNSQSTKKLKEEQLQELARE